MALFYSFKEGFSGFKRARLSTIISIFTMTISLLLLGLFVIIYSNANRMIQSFRDKVEMEVFLSADIDSTGAKAFEERFRSMKGIAGVTYVSKEQAAKIFKKEFGEDINTVLDFNPLPISFKLQLAAEYKNSDSTKVLHDSLAAIDGVDDVLYRKALLEILDRRVKTFIGASAAIGATLLIAAIFLVSNTIRLTIYSKRKVIITMKLVGATRRFIRLPFLIEGMLQGLIGGSLAAGLIYGIIFVARKFVGSDLAEFFDADIAFYGVMIVVGIFLGLLGSSWSVKRFISENIILN